MLFFLVNAQSKMIVVDSDWQSKFSILFAIVNAHQYHPNSNAKRDEIAQQNIGVILVLSPSLFVSFPQPFNSFN